MIQIQPAKNGSLTAAIDGVFLHSSYSPEKEAEKFYKTDGLSRFKTFILLEPGLNYIGRYIRSISSDVKIISIYIEPDFAERDDSISDFSCCFADVSSLKIFLASSMNELDLEQLKLVEWPASNRLFSSRLELFTEVIVQHLRELHGNITTASGFGRKLIRNFVKNYLQTDNIIIPQQSDSTFFIAGSGPGLRSSINFIKENRAGLVLLALPSSVSYLKHKNIEPDIVVTTDPGYYAGFHMREGGNFVTAAPFTALPACTAGRPVLPLNQYSFIESAVLDSSDSFMSLPANGTVAGTALFLAAALTSGSVIISGLDFSFIDLLSHNRPHSFDNYIEQYSKRTCGLHSLYFNRNITGSSRLNSSGRRTTAAMNAYRGWFEHNSGGFAGRFFFLNYFSNPPGGFLNLNEAEAEKLASCPASFPFRTAANTNPDLRRLKIKNFIKEQDDILSSVEKNLNNHQPDGSRIIEILYSALPGSIFLPEILEMKRISFTENSKVVQNKAVSLIRQTRDFLELTGTYAG